MSVIDSHQHFWRIADRAGQFPLPSLHAIHRDFLPADLAPRLAAAGIDGTVLVQSLESLEETRFLLELAAATPFVLGVVGWVDLLAPDAASMIAELAANPWLVGLRPMLQDLEDADWIDDPALDPAIMAIQAHGLRFDALIRPRNLPGLLRFCRRHPALPVVIDHAAKPTIAAGSSPGWREGMAALAALRHVEVKLSGLLTEAATGADPATVAPYVADILSLFGPDRVMWGSDWPVLELAGSYGGWVALCRSMVPEADHPAVFGDNARRFYRLKDC